MAVWLQLPISVWILLEVYATVALYIYIYICICTYIYISGIRDHSIGDVEASTVGLEGLLGYEFVDLSKCHENEKPGCRGKCWC